MSDLVIGIDLGTTNSEVAAFVEGRVRVLGPNASNMLPSCVGIAPTGELLVGETALNQQRIYPERTVRSIKRKMGSTESIAKEIATYKKSLGQNYRSDRKSGLPVGECRMFMAQKLQPGKLKLNMITYLLVNGDTKYLIDFESPQDPQAFEGLAQQIMETFRVKG